MPRDAKITGGSVRAYEIPTDAPESDGTLEWSSTTLVVVQLDAGGVQGLGYTYADTSTALLIRDRLLPLVAGRDAVAIPHAFDAMWAAVRNLGRPGVASMAISAVDVALWDLKGKLLGCSLAALLGQVRPAIPVYGSGGFTSYSVGQLQAQFAEWVESGIARVKMKVGRHCAQDAERVHSARRAIGNEVELFVDANGAYGRKQALHFAERFAAQQVSWLEEPVSSDDLAGLRLLRDRAPAGMAITAGEYGYDLFYFRRMLEAQAIDVLQADATRCGGITGFMAAAVLADAFGVPLSSHCAPALHVAACCAAQRAVHLEYFHDHVRIERMLFDGAPEPRNGFIAPEYERPGLGLDFRACDARRYAS
ncbi:MAG: enolase C-terminal domain-like protein [Betaproteobacteria bacterium]